MVSRIEFLLAGPMFHEVVVVAFEEVWGVEVVRAFGATLPTLETLFGLLHFGVEFIGEVDVVGGAAEEEVHAVATLYFDSGRAGLAIAAATAEIAAEFSPVFLNSAAHIVSESGRVVLERDEFVEFAFALYAPDGFDVRELCYVGVGCGGMVDEASGQCFHGYKTYVVGFAFVDESHFLVAGEVGEGELEGLVETAVDSFVGHGKTVVSDADMTYFALLLGLEHGLVEASAVAGFGAEGGIVELVEVNVVGAEEAEAGFEMLPEVFDASGTSLGADNHFVAPVGESGAEFLLAVRIESGSVEVVHSVVEGFVEQVDGLGGGYALDGERSETVFGDDESAFAQGYCVHGLRCWLMIV